MALFSSSIPLKILRQFSPEKPFTSVQSSGRQSALPSFCPSEQPLALSPCSHEGPVWAGGLGPPHVWQYTRVSCSYDRKVIIWKEGEWHLGEDPRAWWDTRLLRYSWERAGTGALWRVHLQRRQGPKTEANTKQNEKSKDETVGWLVFSCKVYSFQVLVFVLRV